MCEIERKYKDDMYMRISIKYRSDKKLYYLCFEYFKKDQQEDGVVWETKVLYDDSNFNIPIEYVGRYSKKKYEKYCEKLQKNKDGLLGMYNKTIDGEEILYIDIVKALNK